ncbi:MAG: DUF2459 domain-containing protein [Planctomycetota bacterium]|nr:DUF2459 domain-containing protein [Planctomycetota bacterium]
MCSTFRVVGVVILTQITGCVTWNQPTFHGNRSTIEQVGLETPQSNIFVVGHGWHTGIVIPADLISREDWPESAAFPTAKFVEVGWGDEGFYRAKAISLGVTARAMFMPSPSVLHVVGLDRDVLEAFPASDLIEVPITTEQLARLCQAIHAMYERNEDGLPIALGPGLYGDSHFYRAQGSYFYPKTCNVWTAKTLRSAGFPINLVMSTTAGGVLRQARGFGVSRQASSPMAMIHALGFGGK